MYELTSPEAISSGLYLLCVTSLQMIGVVQAAMHLYCLTALQSQLTACSLTVVNWDSAKKINK